VYHAKSYGHMPRTAVQHSTDINQWTVSLGMTKLLESMTQCTNPSATLDAMSLGIGHTLTFPWLGRIHRLFLRLHDTGVSVIDASAIAPTLKCLHVDCIQDKQFSLRITNLHRCSLLTHLIVSFRIGEGQTGPFAIRWVDPESESMPFVDLRVSPQVTRLQMLAHVHIIGRRPIRCPVELAASPVLSQFGVKCWGIDSSKESAIRARRLFTLYTALLRVCKTSLSLDTAWHRLVIKGPIHDPRIIPLLAYRI